MEGRRHPTSIELMRQLPDGAEGVEPGFEAEVIQHPAVVDAAAEPQQPDAVAEQGARPDCPTKPCHGGLEQWMRDR
jgi:hypothetical protein